jgi:hypothetical protein
MRTYNCEPTLTDTQVLDFCKKGFLMLEGVVSEDINRRALDYLQEHPQGEPTEILEEDWFIDGVILNPQAAGAVRSLLGQNFALPNLMSNHLIKTPSPAQGWHRDGGSMFGPELNYLQVFYYPQACPIELGPTELLPGSHFLFSHSSYMGHYGNIRGAYKAASPAGSIFLTIYSIWHRRSAASAEGVRNMLKYNYWRTSSPQRDWLTEPGFDFANADYSLRGAPTFREQFHDGYDAARMFFWLCGRSHEFKVMGGQGWPIPGNFLGERYGFPNSPTAR